MKSVKMYSYKRFILPPENEKWKDVLLLKIIKGIKKRGVGSNKYYPCETLFSNRSQKTNKSK